MGTHRLTSAALIVAVSLLAPACTYQQGTQMFAPTPPSLPTAPAPSGPAPSGNSGSFTGLWAAQANLGAPESWSCTGIQWNVTEETAASISGSFMGLCSEIVLVNGTASGQLDGDEVTIDVEGTASLQGDIVTCPFSLNGVGHIVNENEMRVEYEGTTCMGPVNGAETLRRPAANEPPPPPPALPDPEPQAPEPTAPEPAPANRNHVGPGSLTEDRAEKVVEATAAEFPGLLKAFSTDGESKSAAQQLLLRTIWHLETAGFNAARQRNPSGAISNDKLTIFIGGKWRAYDIFKAYGTAGQATKVIFFQVSPPDPVEHGGIPD